MDHYSVHVKGSFTKKPKTRRDKKEIKIRYNFNMDRYKNSLKIQIYARELYRMKGKRWKWHRAMSKDDGSWLRDNGRSFRIYSSIGVFTADNVWEISKKDFFGLLEDFEVRLGRLCRHNKISFTDTDKEAVRKVILEGVKKKDPFIKIV